MDKVNFIIGQLKRDVKKTINRRRGYLIGSSNVVQHLNPACRAARSVPHLSLARLLISLTDYDVPKAKLHKINILGYFYQSMFWLLISLVLMLSILPELLQDVFVESTVTVIVNMLYFTIFAGGDDIFVAFGVGTAFIFGLFLVAELIARKYRIRNECFLKND